MSLAGHEQSELRARLATETGDSPATRLLVERAVASASAFAVDEEATCLELAAAPPAGAPIGRARLKAFRPDRRRLVAFFYKRSQVPGSRDRYACGAAVMLESEIDPARADAWLDYLASGLHPEHRPADLRRALPYDVPE